MASTIAAGTTSGTAIAIAGDTSGVLQLQTNGTTAAVTIDTNQRAAFVAGTALLPAITTTGDTNTGIFFPAADTIAFTEGGVESMRIDSSGNVGIGTTSPSVKLQVNGATTIAGTIIQNAALFQMNGNGNADLRLVNTAGTTGRRAFDWLSNGDNLRARLLSDDGSSLLTDNLLVINWDGNVGIGLTSSGNKFEVSGSGLFTGAVTTNTTGTHISYQSSNSQIGAWGPDASTNGTLIFYSARSNGSNGLERMRIDSSGGLILAGSTAQKATGTAWSNPSDIRLKDNIQEYTKGLPELMQVNVKTWEYNGKGGTVQGTKGLGVIADEIKKILPDTVDDYKAKLNEDDAEDSDIKKFDATEITWLMLKSIQELNAKVEAQAVRIAELEGAK